MTRQYKNPFEDPDADLYGKKVRDYKIPERKETPLGNKVCNLKDYIYVPSIKLYVAKEISLRGLNWYEAQKELHKRGLQMLTIRQFIDFIFYLEQNKSKIPEAKRILEEILAKRNLERKEWLDAKFSEEVGGLYINYNHVRGKDKLVAQNTELLEKCLMSDWRVDLKSCNKQGLPTKTKGGGIDYYPPREGCVAGFTTDSQGWATLYCCLNREDSPFGVRAARKK